MSTFRLVAGALLAVDLAAAQQVYNVNQANPPGTHFIDLATAAATVPSGSVLNVWPGNYGSFTIDAKAMVVNVSFQASIAADAQGRWCTIRNTAASQTVTIVVTPLATSGVPRVTSCAGPVVIQGHDYAPAPLASSPFQVFEVLDSNQVVLRNGTVGAHMHVQNSTVIAESCSLSGRSNYGTTPATTAVELIGSALQLVESSAYGGQGVGSFGPPPPGAPALQLTNSSVRVCGTAARTISGGNPGLFSANREPFAGTGSVRIDPAIAIVGEPSAATVAIVSQPMSWLTSLTTPYGYPMRATRFSNVNALYAVALSWPAAAASLPGIADPLCIDPNVFHIAAVGAGATPGGVLVQVPVPNHVAFVYTRLVWQSLDLPAVGPWQLTAPSHTIIL
jgi:hypothetical protein